MIFDKYVYDFRLTVRQQQLFDDDELDDRLIKFWINNERATHIRMKFNDNQTIDEQVIQDLGCIEMELGDRSVCPNLPTGYNILQSAVEIPKVIEFSRGDGIVKVGPVDDMAWPFSYLPREAARFIGNGEFNSKIITAFRRGQRMYIIAKRDTNYSRYIRYINVQGVFEDPEAVELFNHIDGTQCYNSATDEYPMNSWMWKYIKEEIKRANFRELVAAPTDTKNDATQTLEVNAKEE